MDQLLWLPVLEAQYPVDQTLDVGIGETWRVRRHRDAAGDGSPLALAAFPDSFNQRAASVRVAFVSGGNLFERRTGDASFRTVALEAAVYSGQCFTCQRGFCTDDQQCGGRNHYPACFHAIPFRRDSQMGDTPIGSAPTTDSARQLFRADRTVGSKQRSAILDVKL